MDKDGDYLSPPAEFPFPFLPYSIQSDFMTSLYQAIEQKKIGIFESPTGTGKSLSLICGALTWLRDHEQREEQKLQKPSANSLVKADDRTDICGAQEVRADDEPEWIRIFEEAQSVAARDLKAKTLREKRIAWNEKLRKMKQRPVGEARVKIYKRKKHADETLALMERARKEIESHEKGLSADQTELDELVPEDYDSGNEDDKARSEDHKAENEDEEGITRVFFCSRTHSQLSQFVHELRKSPFALGHSSTDNSFQVTATSLGSRNSLCINESVRKLRSLHLINERCLEMQKNAKRESKEEDSEQPRKKRRRSSAAATCCYYSNHDGMSRLTKSILDKVLDIEDVVREGKSVEACPYYATRRAVSFCQLVVLPYQTLLHRSTRESTGLRLKDSVVIIDEAHNLVEAMNSMYSVKITRKQTSQALQQLSSYREKFNKRLKAKNLYYVKQLMFVLGRFLEVLNRNAGVEAKDEKLVTVSDFLFDANLDNINFFKFSLIALHWHYRNEMLKQVLYSRLSHRFELLRYCNHSQIAKKLRGFAEMCRDGHDSVAKASSLATFLKEVKHSSTDLSSPPDAASKTDETTVRSPLMHITSFFAALTSSGADARIVVTKCADDAWLKFLALNPSFHFKDILDQCRALIVAGGTMQPSSCLIDQLLAHPEGANHRSRVVEFSCGHVIDSSKQLLPLALSCGPTNASFEFTFAKRSNPAMIDEVGRALLNVCNLVPGGIVCFFPSYEYESLVFKRWSDTGTLQKLDGKKRVFREPKRSDQLDSILKEYASCVERSRAGHARVTGAILLSVVGGKMSEGINFSDWLGRCVVMVGLPYPNLHSLELREKMAYLTKNMSRDKDGRTAGQVHYEDLCMKAVNQSIGRAIRHRNDFACILLLDKRYQKPSVSSKLPKWISEHLQNVDQFGRACVAMRKFFQSQAEETTDT